MDYRNFGKWIIKTVTNIIRNPVKNIFKKLFIKLPDNLDIQLNRTPSFYFNVYTKRDLIRD